MGNARFIARDPRTMSASSLEVESFTVDFVDLGGIAQVTIDLRVHSRADTDLEAVVQLALPTSAAVTAASLYVGEQAMPAVFLSRRKAQRTYERIVGRGKDPLLVTGRGGSVELNVFPVPANGSRRLTLTWVEPVADGILRVPVLGHDRQELAAPSRVRVAGNVVEVRDGAVHLPLAQSQLQVTRAGASKMTYELVSGPTSPSSVVVVVNTSAPGGGYGDSSDEWQETTLKELLAEVAEGASVSVLAADWLVSTITSNASRADVLAILKTLQQRKRAGLLDLGQALSKAVAEAESIGAKVIVWIGPAASRVSHEGDRTWRKRLAEAGLRIVHLPGQRIGWAPVAGPAIMSASSVKALGGAFLHATDSRPDADGWLELPSATGAPVWIRRVANAKPEVGDAVLASAAEALWRRATMLQSPEAYAKPNQEALTQIVDPNTALLALESSEAYKRFGIEVPAQGAPRQLVPDGTVAVGKAAGGRGSGWGVGTTGMRARVQRPDLPVSGIRFERSRISGVLKKGAARRDLRSKRQVFRRCFVRRLKSGTLAGELSLRMGVGPDGRVVDKTVGGLDDPAILKCADQYAASLRFERAKAASTVAVVIVLQPSGASEWKQARERMHKKLKIEIVEEPLAKLIAQGPSSGSGLYWALWQDVVRKAGYFGVGCELVPQLFRDVGKPRAARRVLSECVPSFPKRVQRQLQDWEIAPDLDRVGRLQDPYSFGRR